MTVDQYCRWIGVGHVLMNESHYERIFLASEEGGATQLRSLSQQQLELLGVQYRMDVAVIRKYVQRLVKLGLLEQVPINKGMETCFKSEVSIDVGKKTGLVKLHIQR